MKEPIESRLALQLAMTCAFSANHTPRVPENMPRKPQVTG